MVGRRPAMTMAASSSAMASVSSYQGREARSLAAARCRRRDGLKRSRSTQVAMRVCWPLATFRPAGDKVSHALSRGRRKSGASGNEQVDQGQNVAVRTRDAQRGPGSQDVVLGHVEERF